MVWGQGTVAISPVTGRPEDSFQVGYLHPDMHFRRQEAASRGFKSTCQSGSGGWNSSWWRKAWRLQCLVGRWGRIQPVGAEYNVTPRSGGLLASSACLPPPESSCRMVALQCPMADTATSVSDVDVEAALLSISAEGAVQHDGALVTGTRIAAPAMIAIVLMSVALLFLIGPTAPSIATSANHNPAVGRRLPVHFEGAVMDRRAAMAGVVAATAGVAAPRMARAVDGSSAAGVGAAVVAVDFRPFYGAAKPPASYGGLGGCAKEAAVYSYAINKGEWAEVPVGPIDNRFLGIDSRFTASGGRRAFCVTRARTGEAGKAFPPGIDPKSIINSVSGAEPPSRPGHLRGDLADALQDGALAYDAVTVNGVPFYDFEVSEAATHWLVRVGVSNGRLFAFFVTAPEEAFQADKEGMVKTLKSFTVYDRISSPAPSSGGA